MSNPPEAFGFNYPNAPQISSSLYLGDKESFAGLFLGTILYGVTTAMFFKCMGVLLSPTNPIRGAKKWALVAHTVAMFAFLTIPTGMGLNFSSTSYINNRGFPGDDECPPGLIGYDYIVRTKVENVVFMTMFPLNQWLADGLLLHRCYVIYYANFRAMAIPCLMYLASVLTGIVSTYRSSGLGADNGFYVSYLSVSLSLNILLTLMIIIRLIIHIRDIKKTLGTSNGFNNLFTTTTTVITMLIESYALYAVALLLNIVLLAVGSWFSNVFSVAIGSIQVIAPYLITLRVANRRAMTGEIISGTTNSIHFRTQGTTDDNGSLPDGDHMDSMEVDGEAPSGLGAMAKDAIEEVPS